MKRQTAFFCSECGNEYVKWEGRCKACGSWNTLVEQPKEKTTVKRSQTNLTPAPVPVRLNELNVAGEVCFTTGLEELNRVLGGGVVMGSLCLLSGEPGIGKSTLMMQICRELVRNHSVLYISGEESPRQLRLRGERLGVTELLVLCETELDKALDSVNSSKPDIIIVDSIQTMYLPGVSSAPGSVSQVRECTMSLMRLAKDNNITIFVIGHVNKDGAIAGPKVLEHMVDCVLYFEGERQHQYRILRAEKNRFGSTHEIGVFEMCAEGLREVPNPSEALLAGKPLQAPGSCVACVMEGTRPVLAEIQALICQSSFGTPRRMVNGMDYNRAMLLLAVLEKRAGLFVGNMDAYINVIGGLRMEETACDLAALLAIASSHKDCALPGDLAAFGEVGLTGELRAVPFSAARIAEIYRLGFMRCIVPYQGTKNLNPPDGMTIFRVKNFREACAAAFGS